MTQKTGVAIILLLLGFTLMLFACGTTYSGKIAVKGNEPFTYLALVTANGDFKIVGPLEKKLRDNFQGMVVTVRGTIVKEGRGVLALPELEVTEIVTVNK